MTANFTTLTDPLNLSAAASMLFNGVFGIVCNFLIVYIFVRSPSERSSFNLICVYRGVNNCFILTWGFLGLFVPMTLLGDSLFPPEYQTIVIISIQSAYTGIHHCGFFTALNRFCAMYFPLYYSRFFNIKITSVCMIALGIYRLVKAITQCDWNIPRKCFSIYSTHDLSWLPNLEKECSSAPSGLVYGVLVIFAFLLLMNIATFIKIYFFYRQVELDEMESKRKVRKNKVLFLQTIVQDVTFFIDMLFTYILSGLSTERYWTFISGSFVWQSIHSFDGFIMIMCNERLTLLKKTFFPSSSSNPSVVVQQLSGSVTPMRSMAPVA